MAKSPAPLRRWDVVPAIHPDEDPASIIIRLAAGHFLLPSELFTLYFGQSVKLLEDIGTRSDILEQIEVIAGYDRDLLRSISWRRAPPKKVAFRGRFLPGYWISEYRRVAPAVLARDGEDPYIRLSWRFPAIPFDFESREMLIDRCPSCQFHLTWNGVTSVYRCQACSYDLRQCPPVLARQETVEPARKLAAHIGLLPGKRLTLPFPFDTADEVVEMRLIEWGAWFSGLMRLDLTTSSVHTASAGIDVIANWPASLELAVSLAFRHERTLDAERTALQRSFRNLPTVPIRKAAMQQLAEILKRPEYQKDDGWSISPVGRMYRRS